MNELWPHQVRAIEAVEAAIEAGDTRICLTCPTGGGKTRTISELILRYIAREWLAVVYTNRRFMVEQLARVFKEAGIPFGIRAGDFEPDLGQPIQISSIQTEYQRCVKRSKWAPHGEGRRCILFADEAHQQATGEALELLTWHASRGHVVVGTTATPIDIGHFYTRLIVMATNSELRDCGALVWARHFGPDEPDLRKFRAARGEGHDLSEAEQRKAMGPKEALYGRIWKWFQTLNPLLKPTLCFAPGVPESLWIAQQFFARGVPAAHIDGNNLWVNGALKEATPETRLEMMEAWENGSICVVSNRYVCREGIDAPWVAHLILATVYGSVQSYLQSGGRGLRAHHTLDALTVQDHAGNWWRHGSLNSDRAWHLNQTESGIYADRADPFRRRFCLRCRQPLEKENPACKACGFINPTEPRRCPNCALILVKGKCEGCGFDCHGAPRARPVVTTDGDIFELHGHCFKERPICKAFDGRQKWKVLVLHRSKPTKKYPDNRPTFYELEARFARENYWHWPDRRWPYMPLAHGDLHRRVVDVRPQDLIQEEAHVT